MIALFTAGQHDRSGKGENNSRQSKPCQEFVRSILLVGAATNLNTHMALGRTAVLLNF